MNRFEPVLPFVNNFKVFVTVEGDVTQQPYLQLQEAVNEATLRILSPDYLPWLETKGGACPRQKPAFLPHTPSPEEGICSKCNAAYTDSTKPAVVVSDAATMEAELAAASAEPEPEPEPDSKSSKIKGKR